MRIIPMLVILLCCYCSSYSQDKLYSSTVAKQGKIIDINESLISYNPSSDSKRTENIQIRNVLVVFNDKGGYLLPSKLDMKDEAVKKAVKSFLSQDIPYWKTDRIYYNDKTIEDIDIKKEDDKELEVLTNNQVKKIPKTQVALIIYKNGRHIILSKAEPASLVLQQAGGAWGGISPVAMTPLKKTLEQPAFQNTSATDAIPANIPPKTIDDFLTADLKKEFKEKATDKTRQFDNYLIILCNRSNSEQKMNDAITGALALFVSDSSKIEVSNVNTQANKPKPIKTYLNDLRRIHYDKVTIEWTNVQYIDNIKLAKDGTYRGTVTFEQKFTGINDGIVAYQDITEKKAEIIMSRYIKVVEGQNITAWDVRINNVKVVQTRPVQ